MDENNNRIDRRNFLKSVGAAGLGSVLAAGSLKAGEEKPKSKSEQSSEKEEKETKFPQVPKRKLGKTGVHVPILSLGAMFNVVDNQIILPSSLKWGVNYWDTAHSYAGGKSEKGIGQYLKRNPEIRKKLFIVSKASGAHNNKSRYDRLKESLKRMNTDYVDLYYGVHGLEEPEQLSDELREWVKNAKKEGLIRFFGFSTHENMPECLQAAARTDWIDAIMTSYNFRLIQRKEMQEAVEACNKAGIGLIAMKTQAGRQKISSEEDKKLAGHFLKKGYTQGQAKIKAVLEDERFATACVGMRRINLLTENVAAVLDKTKLSNTDRNVFNHYAAATCSGYCLGCSHICKDALPEVPYVAKIMRYLMYNNSYGEHERARKLFAQIPKDVRKKLTTTDYSLAEARCPQNMPIAKLMKEATQKLA